MDLDSSHGAFVSQTKSCLPDVWEGEEENKEKSNECGGLRNARQLKSVLYKSVRSVTLLDDQTNIFAQVDEALFLNQVFISISRAPKHALPSADVSGSPSLHHTVFEY